MYIPRWLKPTDIAPGAVSFEVDGKTFVGECYYCSMNGFFWVVRFGEFYFDCQGFGACRKNACLFRSSDEAQAAARQWAEEACARQINSSKAMVKEYREALQAIVAPSPPTSVGVDMAADEPDCSAFAEIEEKYGEAVKAAIMSLEPGPIVMLPEAQLSPPGFVQTAGFIKGSTSEITWIDPSPKRVRLDHTRRGLTHHFEIDGHDGYVTLGFYEDGRIGEVFIRMAKEGSTLAGLVGGLGTVLSIGLQYGIPLEVFCRKMAHTRFEPHGHTGNPDIPIAKSILDYIFRWLGNEYVPGFKATPLPEPRLDPVPVKTAEEKVDPREMELALRHISSQELAAVASFTAPNGHVSIPSIGPQSDAPACRACGGITQRAGACYVCTKCGESNGCG